MPLHHPVGGQLIGFLDLTGGGEAVGVHSLPLLTAVATAVRQHLVLPAPGTSSPERGQTDGVSLRSLGTDQAVLSTASGQVRLGRRHSEILTLLMAHPEGMSAARLGEELLGEDHNPTTLRAEMVRLRRVLESSGLGVALESRPYRLSTPVDGDTQTVLTLLDRGDYRTALAAYPGPLLPGSPAPGVEGLRHSLHERLRQGLLQGADLDTLMAYLTRPEGREDAEAWYTALQLMAPDSPRRAVAVAALAALEDQGR